VDPATRSVRETPKSIRRLGLRFQLKAVPAGEVIGKILGYSGMIDRDLNRAYDRLERLQRRRKGEFALSLSELERERMSENQLAGSWVFTKRSQQVVVVANR
jgi:hypothetical protein